MKELRRIAIHLVLLAVAATVAYVKAQPADDSARPLEPGEVELWGGSPSDVVSIRWSGKRKVVILEQKKDEGGAWFLGKVEAPPEDTATTDGAGGAAHGKPKPMARPKVKPATFVSVSTAEKLLKKIIPMRAKQAIGAVEDDRLKAFGLDKPAGTLTIEVGGKKHELVFGSTTLGTSDVYVRYLKDNLVYLVDIGIKRDIEGGAARLSERQQHAWKPSEAQNASVTAGTFKRKGIRGGTEGRRFWASADAPDSNDETFANWLSKVKRLRPVKFLEALPEGTSLVLRVDYGGEGKGLGFLELHRREESPGKVEFFMLTENLRLPATVAKTVAEQVHEDLTSLFPDMPAPKKTELPPTPATGKSASVLSKPAGSAAAAPGAPPGHGKPTAPPGHAKPSAPHPPTAPKGDGHGHGSGHDGHGH